jgi:ATP phosphoribosyltransferase regulatory subunit
MPAWLLPDHIADVLPSEARHIEELRRSLLDTARGYGYELVMPPLVEHIESLLTGTGQALGLQTFKLVDQLSGRTLGLRADTTPQAARIDAHLLNRHGVTRLCYCGPVLHTRPERAHATREPLQFGAEIFGHAGLEADLEALQLTLDCLKAAKVGDVLVDLSDARISAAVLADVKDTALLQNIHAALAAKDSAALREQGSSLPEATLNNLLALVQLYGDAQVLVEAEKALRPSQNLCQQISNLKWLASHITVTGAKVSFDLAGTGGYAYYSGARFAVYSQTAGDALARGGRYDKVGAVFGRSRPAVGFSLDVKALVQAVRPQPLRVAVRAPWGEDASLQAAVALLRSRGEVVMCVLPGHEHEVDEFNCDRQLVQDAAGQWVVKAV